jgi:ubiquinone/menaquinone biosynthesis C-methylase UbiE
MLGPAAREVTLTRASEAIWIGYTTLYREGGPKFERAALTLAADKRKQFPELAVRCERVESKAEFLAAMQRLADEGVTLRELHLIVHSGMYGPMFGSVAWPEQFSPHEWRTMKLPLGPRRPGRTGSEAFFHACRSARWFAPFFARTHGVPAHGYHWYTTVSAAPDRFRWDGLVGADAPLWIFGMPGRKSHGALGSLRKYLGIARPEQMQRFEPAPLEGDPSYDAVAEQYDRVFADIRVRSDEWRWLDARVPDGARVLDVGCGNGALLTLLAPRIASGVGVDASAGMISRARARAADLTNLRFEVIDGPKLPLPDASVDVVISLLSFRYLDWDPIMREFARVLAPGGRLLVVDMVAAPLAARELPRLLRDKARNLAQRVRHRRYHGELARMVGDPRWRDMLRYNPIRAIHELRWYFQSRFPKGTAETLNLGWHARVLAFDTGPFEHGRVTPQSFP